MTDVEIKQAIYTYLKDSDLHKEVSGELTKYPRADDAVSEDICISVLSSSFGQIQESFANVNIYVQDITRTDSAHAGQLIENEPRLRVLCKLAEDALLRHNGGEYRFTLYEQRVIASPNGREHIINNKILLTISNE